MPAQFTTPLVVVIAGQVIASSLWNAEFSNLYTNLTPAGIDTWSNTDVQMQTQTDPFPGSVTSRPTSLAGEIERLRFTIQGIKGSEATYWYNPPADTVGSLNTRVSNLENGVTGAIVSGVIMPFYQAAAPTGWTKLTSQNDKALRVVSGSGGGSGGTNAMSAGLSHSHTVNSHTHDLGNHTHTMGNHTHSTPNHQHPLETEAITDANTQSVPYIVANAPSQKMLGYTAGGSTHLNIAHGQTTSSGSGTSGTPSSNTSDGPSTNTSGGTAPGTDTQSPTFQYIDVILCQKN